jgi:hypothetical protein
MLPTKNGFDEKLLATWATHNCRPHSNKWCRFEMSRRNGKELRNGKTTKVMNGVNVEKINE